MTRQGHQLSALLAMAATASLSQRVPVVQAWFADQSIWHISLGAMLFFSGANAPDWLERAGTRERVIPHRTHTHVLLFWVLMVPGFGLLASASPMLLANSMGNILAHVFTLLVYFALGGVLHLMLDVCTPSGIPLAWGTQKPVSLRLYRTGALSEGIFLLILGFATLAVTAPDWLGWVQQLGLA